jgi:hypothetical protein
MSPTESDANELLCRLGERAMFATMAQRRREAAAGHRTAEKPGGEQAHWRRGAVSKGRSEEGAAEGPPALYSATLLGALDELFHCLLLLPAVLCQACGPQI